MKLSVVFFVVLVASACANDEQKAQKEELARIETKCLKEADTTKEELHKCIKEKKHCPKMDCYESCDCREHGFINQDGTINKKLIEQFEAVLIQHGHPKTAKAMKKCFVDPEKKLPFCEVGPALHNCMEKEAQD